METADHCPSILLTPDQNNQVFELLGSRCQTLSTTVIQLFCTRPPNHQQWVKEYTGVLCFVKDNTRRNYFFRLYCINSNCLLWEHEMYNNMEYNESTKFFHRFEGELGIVAFNFADTVEARHFITLVESKILLRKSKKNECALKQSNGTGGFVSYVLEKNHDEENTKSNNKKLLKKTDIGLPTDFRHVTHVGFNEINFEDFRYKDFFAMAGVSNDHLKDKQTRRIIDEFLNEHGGIDRVVGPPLPPRGADRTSDVRAKQLCRPPPIPKETLIPPSIIQASSTPINALPPPPPPPLLMSSSTLESNSSHCLYSVSAGGMDTCALMNSIKGKVNLKPVSQEDNRPPLHDTRNDLLGDIRKGIRLKPAGDREVKPLSQLPSESGFLDMAKALKDVLAKRNDVMGLQDDDDDDDKEFEDEDNDWKD